MGKIRSTRSVRRSRRPQQHHYHKSPVNSEDESPAPVLEPQVMMNMTQGHPEHNSKSQGIEDVVMMDQEELPMPVLYKFDQDDQLLEPHSSSSKGPNNNLSGQVLNDASPEISPEATTSAEPQRKVERHDDEDTTQVVLLADRALDIANDNVTLKMTKAKALVKLKRFIEANELSTEALQSDPKCLDAYYVRGLCYYDKDNTEKAIQFVQQALKIDPDNPTCLSLFRSLKKLRNDRATAAELFDKCNMREAKEKYVECLEIANNMECRSHSVLSKLYFNLALCSHKLKDLDGALEYYTKAIDLNSSYVKALIYRAVIYKEKEMFDEAVRDYEEASQLDPSNGEYKKLVRDTKMAAKRAKCDYYQILGVERNASGDDVKKAYKKRALIHHPDRHASATESARKDQERQFKELGKAYQIISDPEKRSMYDNIRSYFDFE